MKKLILVILSLVLFSGCSFGIIGLDGEVDNNVIYDYVDDPLLAEVLPGTWYFKKHILLDTYKEFYITFYKHTSYVQIKTIVIDLEKEYVYKCLIQDNKIYLGEQLLSPIQYLNNNEISLGTEFTTMLRK